MTTRTADRPAGDGTGNVLVRTVAAGTDVVRSGRRRAAWFDHLVHAGGHYNRAQADMLAAGVTYYVFLALFPVLLLVAAIAGFVLSGDQLLQDQLTTAVRDAVPGSTGVSLAEQVESAIDSRGLVGVIGLAGFLFVGLAAMDKVRTGMDVLWRGEPGQSDFVMDRVKDLGGLLGFAVAGVLSLGITTATTTASSLVIDRLGLDGVPGISLATSALGLALAVLGDTLLFLWLLKGVPSTPFGYRDLLPGAVFGAVGFEGLKAVGSWYLSVIGGNVTARTLGGFVGLIVWINVVARFAFFTAAWTATIPRIEAARLALTAEPPEPGPALPTSGPSPVGRAGLGAGTLRAVTVLVLALLAGGAVLGAAGSRLLPAALRRRRRTAVGGGGGPPP